MNRSKRFACCVGLCSAYAITVILPAGAANHAVIARDCDCHDEYTNVLPIEGLPQSTEG